MQTSYSFSFSTKYELPNSESLSNTIPGLRNPNILVILVHLEYSVNTIHHTVWSIQDAILSIVKIEGSPKNKGKGPPIKEK